MVKKFGPVVAAVGLLFWLMMGVLSVLPVVWFLRLVLMLVGMIGLFLAVIVMRRWSRLLWTSMRMGMWILRVVGLRRWRLMLMR